MRQSVRQFSWNKWILNPKRSFSFNTEFTPECEHRSNRQQSHQCSWIREQGRRIRSARRPPHWPLEFHLGRNIYMIFDFEESWAQKIHPSQSHAYHMCSSGRGIKKTCEQHWLQRLNRCDFFFLSEILLQYWLFPSKSNTCSCYEANCVVRTLILLHLFIHIVIVNGVHW